MLLLGLVDIPTWLFWVVTITVLLYILGTRNHSFFKGTGIPGPKPWPFVGNALQMMSGDFIDYDIKLRAKYGNIVGTFMGSKPEIIIFDEEMVSQVMIKQFSSFSDRRAVDIGDPVFDNMLTNVNEIKRWKHLRSTMSSGFTTGKMRRMAKEINRGAQILVDKMASNGPFETREIASCYGMIVTASTAFGLRIDGNPDDPFVVNAQKIMNISMGNPLIIISMIFPSMAKYFIKLGLHIFDKDATAFFVQVLKQAMQVRKEGEQKGTDFLQIMADAQLGKATYDKEEEHEVEKFDTKPSKSGLTEDELLGNALAFFLAGYESGATSLTMFLYCLTMSPDCQQKCIEEIDKLLGDNGEVDYDTIMKMTYLDMCLQETFRMYTQAFRTERVATENLTLNGIPIKKGTVIIIPSRALQRDPEVWSEPEKFNPDRFTAEEKAKRNPVYSMPFGIGPRMCIASRIAEFQLKVAVVHILQNHRLVKCDKTEDPIIWKKDKILQAENGIWLAIEKRK